MADFVTHGLIGAGVMAAPAKFFKAPKWLKNTLAVYGFVLGTVPDTFDWINATVFGGVRWQLYTYFHRDADWWWLVQPPVFMHVKVTDPPFHIISGWNWWPTLAWLEISWAMVAIALLWYAYRPTSVA